MNEVGKATNRIDAFAKVTGKAKYPGDFTFADQLIMKVLFSEKVHARILSIDTSAAEALEGVVLVLTAKDVPVNEYGLGVYDQPVLCGPGSAKPGTDVVRFEGDQVALVIAESAEIAQKALLLIKVEYQELPLVKTLGEALKEDATILHPGRTSNIFHHNVVRLGNTQEAFEACDVIVESEYQTPVQEHAYLQPEAGVAFLDEEERITIVVGGQWTHKDQAQTAHALGMPNEKVRVIYPAIGGAFGGREDMSVQIILGLAAMRLHEKGVDRPVKIVWTREESIVGHCKRHAYTMKAKWGATKEGKIMAAQCEIWANGGAYAYTSPKVLGNATLLATGPYEIPNVSTDAYAVYTNDIPGGAFRGFGGPQAIFMAEMQVNKLAEALQMDPVELRMRNLFKEGSTISMGSVIPEGVTIREVTERCALEAGWTKTEAGWERPTLPEPENPHIKSAWGLTCGYKNVGFSYGAPENCGATIILEGNQDVAVAKLYHAGAEVGQGAHTVFAQMAADALGLPLSKIQTFYSDTATSLDSGSVSASRMTHMGGNSILGAARVALEKWAEGNRPAIGSYVYRPPKTSSLDPVDGHCFPNFTYGYAAQAFLVDVDTRSGNVHLREVISVDDVGKAINPQLVEGQIEGAVVQASGYTLLEDFKKKDGRTISDRFSKYLIPTVKDIPDKTRSVIMELADPIGPFGARGMGEMPYLPFAPGVLEAVHQATGVWFDRFPLTDEAVLRGLGKLPAHEVGFWDYE
ncbi:MAG: xanthine dehydrogenase family protein molybdopterin-binding subunit [Anaerolineaceae bacterium]|nr:xanthine dehydrogenase family protein molybdopterin-binding subunit [Anaerolineaceae bacterium]MDD4577944.1 xanthine dehydrogenase family protein molybdopterin-binding subunit [Anaerolineaceae bacterium]